MDAMRAEKETLFAQRTHDLAEALKEAQAAKKTLDSQIQILMNLKRKVDSMEAKEANPGNHTRTPHRRRHDRYRNETSNSHATYPGYHRSDICNASQFIIIPASSVQHFAAPNPRSFTHNHAHLKFTGSKKAAESMASTEKTSK